MAITADYIVVSDAAITLVPPGGGQRSQIHLHHPDWCENCPSQNPILTFMAWAKGGIV
jgi:hypothetical protein